MVDLTESLAIIAEDPQGVLENIWGDISDTVTHLPEAFSDFGIDDAQGFLKSAVGLPEEFFDDPGAWLGEMVADPEKMLSFGASTVGLIGLTMGSVIGNKAAGSPLPMEIVPLAAHLGWAGLTAAEVYNDGGSAEEVALEFGMHSATWLGVHMMSGPLKNLLGIEGMVPGMLFSIGLYAALSPLVNGMLESTVENLVVMENEKITLESLTSAAEEAGIDLADYENPLEALAAVAEANGIGPFSCDAAGGAVNDIIENETLRHAAGQLADETLDEAGKAFHQTTVDSYLELYEEMGDQADGVKNVLHEITSLKNAINGTNLAGDKLTLDEITEKIQAFEEKLGLENADGNLTPDEINELIQMVHIETVEDGGLLFNLDGIELITMDEETGAFGLNNPIEALKSLELLGADATEIDFASLDFGSLVQQMLPDAREIVEAAGVAVE